MKMSDEQRNYTWKPGISLELICCEKCGNSGLMGEEVPAPDDYDFCIHWLCTKCHNLVQETKGYNCQFDESEGE
jgi:hypothetical protein